MAMANTYDVGDSVRISGSFTVLNVATDPTAVLMKVKKPGATESTVYDYGQAQVVKDSTGKFHVDIIIDRSGRWYYRWEGTGACYAASEDSFMVRGQKVP